LRNYGSEVKYHNQAIGYNSRLDELQAAFLRAKLAMLDVDNERRCRIAHAYTEGLRNVKALLLPQVAPGCDHVWHLYVVRHPQREAFARALARPGIATITHYHIPA